jgi:PAS domain S-box-containing protein
LKLTVTLPDSGQTEKALREQTQYLKDIIDTNSDLVAVTDLEGNFKFTGPSHTILGWDLDSLVGRNVMDLVHPDDYPQVAEAFADFLARRKDSRKVEYRCRQANGNYLWLETVGKYILDDEDNPKEILFISRDFTERKRAEAALEANYTLLKTAGETARFGGWSVNLEDYTCTWSDTVADIHEAPRGYAPSVEEAINFYAPEWIDRITLVFNACAGEGIPYDEEMEIITLQGNRVWVRATGRAVKNENGKIVKVLGSFQDITIKSLPKKP